MKISWVLIFENILFQILYDFWVATRYQLSVEGIIELFLFFSSLRLKCMIFTEENFEDETLIPIRGQMPDTVFCESMILG